MQQLHGLFAIAKLLVVFVELCVEPCSCPNEGNTIGLSRWEIYLEHSFSHGFVHESRTINSGKIVQEMFSLEF